MDLAGKCHVVEDQLWWQARGKCKEGKLRHCRCWNFEKNAKDTASHSTTQREWAAKMLHLFPGTISHQERRKTIKIVGEMGCLGAWLNLMGWANVAIRILRIPRRSYEEFVYLEQEPVIHATQVVSNFKWLHWSCNSAQCPAQAYACHSAAGCDFGGEINSWLSINLVNLSPVNQRPADLSSLQLSHTVA